SLIIQMNGAIQQHRLATVSALRSVCGSRDIHLVPALAELTAKRGFFFSQGCFSHLREDLQGSHRKLQKPRHTRIVTNSHYPANCNSKPADWGFTDTICTA